VCKSGDESATCLTPQEASAILKIWNGPTTSSGRRLWFGLERGAALAALAGSTPFPIALTHVQYWIHRDPNFDWHTLSESGFEGELQASRKAFNSVIGTDNPDLGALHRRGGKMIIWHGEADQLIPPRGTLNYFDRMLAANGGASGVAEFARLYMAPGVGHCGGGDGPAPSGLFEAVVNWVEKNIAPATVAASRRGPGGVTLSRPLCPYPTTAKWTGSGSTDIAANFACVDGQPPAGSIRIER
jgi:hypothetical protein